MSTPQEELQRQQALDLEMQMAEAEASTQQSQAPVDNSHWYDPAVALAEQAGSKLYNGVAATVTAPYEGLKSVWESMQETGHPFDKSLLALNQRYGNVPGAIDAGTQIAGTGAAIMAPEAAPVTLPAINEAGRLAKQGLGYGGPDLRGHLTQVGSDSLLGALPLADASPSEVATAGTNIVRSGAQTIGAPPEVVNAGRNEAVLAEAKANQVNTLDTVNPLDMSSKTEAIGSKFGPSLNTPVGNTANAAEQLFNLGKYDGAFQRNNPTAGIDTSRGAIPNPNVVPQLLQNIENVKNRALGIKYGILEDADKAIKEPGGVGITINDVKASGPRIEQIFKVQHTPSPGGYTLSRQLSPTEVLSEIRKLDTEINATRFNDNTVIALNETNPSALAQIKGQADQLIAYRDALNDALVDKVKSTLGPDQANTLAIANEDIGMGIEYGGAGQLFNAQSQAFGRQPGGAAAVKPGSGLVDRGSEGYPGGKLNPLNYMPGLKETRTRYQEFERGRVAVERIQNIMQYGMDKLPRKSNSLSLADNDVLAVIAMQQGMIASQDQFQQLPKLIKEQFVKQLSIMVPGLFEASPNGYQSYMDGKISDPMEMADHGKTTVESDAPLHEKGKALSGLHSGGQYISTAPETPQPVALPPSLGYSDFNQASRGLPAPIDMGNDQNFGSTDSLKMMQSLSSSVAQREPY